MRRAVIIGTLACGLLVPSTAGALSVGEVAREVRCPTCERPLNVSDAPAARDMKAFIGERIDEGWGEERIIDALVAQFGESVRATPPASGFGLVAWAVPVGFVALGILALAALAGAWRAAGARDPPAQRPPTADELERLRRELKRRR